MIKKITLLLVAILFTASANAFDIYALGTSATNCRGVDRTNTIPAHLEKLLKTDGYDINVINGGIDGDRPQWMGGRLEGALKNPNVKLIIFEPGPNETNTTWNVNSSEKILSILQDKKIPTIYISNGSIQTRDEAAVTAKKYGAYYYGGLGKNLPIDREHRQFDVPGNPWGGHMTALGCQKVAEQLQPLVKEIIRDLAIN